MRGRRTIVLAGLLALAGCDDPPPAWHADVAAEELTSDKLAGVLTELLRERIEGCDVERAAEARLLVRMPDGRSFPLYLRSILETAPKRRAERVERRLAWFVEQVEAAPGPPNSKND